MTGEQWILDNGVRDVRPLGKGLLLENYNPVVGALRVLLRDSTMFGTTLKTRIDIALTVSTRCARLAVDEGNRIGATAICCAAIDEIVAMVDEDNAKLGVAT